MLNFLPYPPFSSLECRIFAARIVWFQQVVARQRWLSPCTMPVNLLKICCIAVFPVVVLNACPVHLVFITRSTVSQLCDLDVYIILLEVKILSSTAGKAQLKSTTIHSPLIVVAQLPDVRFSTNTHSTSWKDHSISRKSYPSWSNSISCCKPECVKVEFVYIHPCILAEVVYKRVWHLCKCFLLLFWP